MLTVFYANWNFNFNEKVGLIKIPIKTLSKVLQNFYRNTVNYFFYIEAIYKIRINLVNTFEMTLKYSELGV